jgi:hypothetical protein
MGSEECPVPRKTRFPNLCILNGQIITKLDIMRIFCVGDVSKLIENPKEKRLLQ